MLEYLRTRYGECDAEGFRLQRDEGFDSPAAQTQVGLAEAYADLIYRVQGGTMMDTCTYCDLWAHHYAIRAMNDQHPERNRGRRDGYLDAAAQLRGSACASGI